jgi:hypothetical protein
MTNQVTPGAGPLSQTILSRGLGMPLFGSATSVALHDGPGRAHSTRTFVSAERVLDALRSGLGCREIGERGAGCSYWRTPGGVRFRVDDPTTDLACAAVVRADGRQQLFYSYQAAVALVRDVMLINLVRGPDTAA